MNKLNQVDGFFCANHQMYLILGVFFNQLPLSVHWWCLWASIPCKISNLKIECVAIKGNAYRLQNGEDKFQQVGVYIIRCMLQIQQIQSLKAVVARLVE